MISYVVITVGLAEHYVTHIMDILWSNHFIMDLNSVVNKEEAKLINIMKSVFITIKSVSYIVVDSMETISRLII